jgi:chloramphenicol-sensitive protein RarD
LVVDERRRGFLFGAAAFLIWGLFPLYWPLLKPAGAAEILANRVVWSGLFVVALIVALGRAARLRAVLVDKRARRILAAAAMLIACNWGTYIWGVNNGHVVETSLGYFINPLFTVLLGVSVLGERLRRWQWIALGVAFVAVVELTIEYGRPPWIALILTFSFGTYGLAKKKANVGALEGLAVETAVLAPLAVVFMTVLAAGGDSHFSGYGIGHALLLIGTGVVTAVPLVLFGGAATRVPLTTLGLLQYIAPIAQFALGLLVFHEYMSTARWVGFILVWVALTILTAESFRNRRLELRDARAAQLADSELAAAEFSGP